MGGVASSMRWILYDEIEFTAKAQPVGLDSWGPADLGNRTNLTKS